MSALEVCAELRRPGQAVGPAHCAVEGIVLTAAELGAEHLQVFAKSQDSSAACSPLLLQAKHGASSQRSAGTVSGGAPEVAQQHPPAAASASPSLKRPLSSADLEGLCLDQDSHTSSQGFSKSQRSSREGTPARQRVAAQRARALWTEEDGDGEEALESGDEAGTDLDSACGLNFLLQACAMLDPLATSVAVHAAAMPTPVKRGLAALSASVSAEGSPNKLQRQVRYGYAGGAASADASPMLASARRPVSRRLLAREAAEQDADYVPEAGSDYEAGSGAEGDADYQPSGRPARTSTRAQRASARGIAAAAAGAAAAVSDVAVAVVAPAPAPAPARGGRWGGEPKQLITGPCQNPECEHPHDSPQWRKGPPQFPVLCNACGTRWLRNGTLKPLVPRRGLRYKNKPKPAAKGKAAAGCSTAGTAGAPQLPPQLQHHHLAAVLPLAVQHCPTLSSDGSAEGRSDSDVDPAALFNQHGSLQLPMPPPLQTALPAYLPAGAALPYNPSLAFGPAAVFGSIDPAAAAAAAAAAFQAAPHMFAGGLGPGASPVLPPWGFFASAQQHAQQPPALFCPVPAPAQQAAAAADEVQQEGPAAGVGAAAAIKAEQQQQQQELQQLTASPFEVSA